MQLHESNRDHFDFERSKRPWHKKCGKNYLSLYEVGAIVRGPKSEKAFPLPTQKYVEPYSMYEYRILESLSATVQIALLRALYHREIHFFRFPQESTATMDPYQDAATGSSIPSQPNVANRKKVNLSRVPTTSMPGVPRMTSDSTPEENQGRM